MAVAAAVIRCRRLNIPRAFVISMMINAIQAAIGRSMDPLLTPPAGNSLHIKASSVDGVQIYTCSGGEWRFLSASASLVDSSNSSIFIGTYAYVYSPKHVSAIGTWSLNNSEGVIAESGHAASEVTGRVIAFRGNKFALPAFLAQASSHLFDGTASLVSYIQQIPSDGGVPPGSSSCRKGSRQVHIPFEADYWFWTQDRQPPSVPSELSAIGLMIEGFFGTGHVKYVFNGTSWQQKNITASMYDVPGGILVGRFFIESHADDAGGSFTWEVFNPNGWTVTAKSASPGVQVDGSSLPWRLFSVTSASFNESFLGPITQVQMISTRGGLPPTPMQAQAVVGRVWISLYTSVYWFYTPYPT
ncbi:hypothetical protein O6H91_23G035100 [Diphasiastrum complanatum]|uniref:Uncharacterized protein n=1 Tax=Diphasiastrum complanatum TaxID=34168 RepID=A0ACC2A9N0_DIPCM|nr:hypothetical protein O6H91_23G035100 [Diphasiastrum complanatum]